MAFIEVVLPLRTFAVPSPRRGSIEPHSGYGRSAAEGQEIHARIQRERKRLDCLYQAEVAVTASFERRGYSFRIEGRMDGIFRHDPPKIEEIKSSFNIRELRRRLEDDPMSHPYGLQLLSYGYFHWRENKVLPTLSFHLVSSRSAESYDLELSLDISHYESWLDRRLDELLAETQQAEKRAARRRKTAAGLEFPFGHARPGQIELMQEIEMGMMKAKPMLIQAPTGLGKTVGVLHPVLREALSRGHNVIYVTPKNSQHSVAEDAISRFHQTGSRVKALTITAKGKICFKNEPLCNPEYCEYARDYYTKFHEQGIAALLSKKRRLKARIFRQIGERYEVCPFELQIEVVREADVVICDYNYVFGSRSALWRGAEIRIDNTGKPNLIIDEAHNLPSRAMESYSPALSSVVLEKMRSELGRLPPRLRHETESVLDGCIETIRSCGEGRGAAPTVIDPPVRLFTEQDARLRMLLSRYLESDTEIGRQDPVLQLALYWSEFTEALDYAADTERKEFFTTFYPHGPGGTVKITCCDPSQMLRERYRDYRQVVAFSATLKPFEYYMRLSGLDTETTNTAEFLSPFPKDRRKLLIIPQVSTKYSLRERNYAKIAQAVQRITALRRGNYLVFLPSFDFLERVAALFKPATGFTVARQGRSMKPQEIQTILEQLKGEIPTIVFAVQGGSFSEGIDYPGEMAIGAFVVGPPLPNYDLEREQMREYYERTYGAGFDYAYTIPAMAKAVQAAGRIIRSETDRGLIILMDRRFTEATYAGSMPADWYDSKVTELVSEKILADVADFWKDVGGSE
ncbi:ATP-dependent DNA helicase [Geobacter sp. DSM 9736]|uniref:ATP-dependent DNA helicase n=1 Tax=Geobacter sp. DSM 9736 TaxID=1277350 RepID=UPI000B506EC6|nr:ATP-dependent DNA helicase [Geobacter sp. DSM 9736]SNB45544.1 DNA excision repair protein ERCC-2 [Geobacter sp. DSM 9736]